MRRGLFTPLISRCLFTGGFGFKLSPIERYDPDRLWDSRLRCSVNAALTPTACRRLGAWCCLLREKSFA